MTASSQNDYSTPIARLISLGEKRIRGDWPDYLELGITSAHVPELISILQDIEKLWEDEEGDPDPWCAPIHAWRALGQLRAPDAIHPLITLLDQNEKLDSDWIGEEVPVVLGMIGSPAIPALQNYLLSPVKKLWAAISAGHSLSEIGQRHPDSRDACVAALQSGLEDFAQNDETLNGFLISYLAELKAVEAAPLVEGTYQADRVDLSILGDYEDFQMDVGLLEKRLTPPPRYQWIREPEAQWQADKEAQRKADQRQREQAKKDKQKRKQAKKARRRKRK